MRWQSWGHVPAQHRTNDPDGWVGPGLIRERRRMTGEQMAGSAGSAAGQEAGHAPKVSGLKVSRRSRVDPFEVMTILDKVARLRAEGHQVISLCSGEPSQGAPADVRARAAEVVTDGTVLGYSPALGIGELRTAIADHYRRWYDLDVSPASVAVTTGSSGAFVAGFLAAFDVGDRVALARPGYAAYKNILAALGCEVVELDCGPAQRFQPTIEQLQAEHTRRPLSGLVLASPANPTGTMVSGAELAELAHWCREDGVRLISDEIYHGVTFGTGVSDNPRGDCAWTHDRSGLVVSSFSKFWGMTGWRLGWALVPDDLIGGFDALVGNAALCPPVPAQYAAVQAFTENSCAEGEAAVRRFAQARQVMLDALPELGWVDVAPADGAFYFYATITPVLGGYADSREWCAALLEHTEVAVTPGVDFDSVGGAQAVRISLAAGPEAVAEAVRRILAFQQQSP